MKLSLLKRSTLIASAAISFLISGSQFLYAQSITPEFNPASGAHSSSTSSSSHGGRAIRIKAAVDVFSEGSSGSSTRKTISDSDTYNANRKITSRQDAIVESYERQSKELLESKKNSRFKYRPRTTKRAVEVVKPRRFLDKALEIRGVKPSANFPNTRWKEANYEYEVRIKKANEEYGRNGLEYRVSRRKEGLTIDGQGHGTEYIDIHGDWHQERVLKERYTDGRINPDFNPQAAHETHIEIPDHME